VTIVLSPSVRVYEVLSPEGTQLCRAARDEKERGDVSGRRARGFIRRVYSDLWIKGVTGGLTQARLMPV
jgi:hypothetical protein